MSELNRDSFVFYKSFFEAIDECPIDNQRNIYRAIAIYALRGEEDSDLKGVEKAIFTMAKPQIDANTKRYLNGTKGKEYGKKGGAPKGNKNAAKNKDPDSSPDSSSDSSPDSKPEPKPETEEKMTGLDFFVNGVANMERLKSFAVSRGYKERDADNFFEYNMFHRPMGSNSKDLFDKDGNVIGNVYGAFLNFMSSGYDRETWLKERGMKKGQNNP